MCEGFYAPNNCSSLLENHSILVYSSQPSKFFFFFFSTVVNWCQANGGLKAVRVNSSKTAVKTGLFRWLNNCPGRRIYYSWIMTKLLLSFNGAFRGDPEVNFMAADGVEHCVWPVRDPVVVFSLQRAFEAVQSTYIADGHHRSASAFRWGYGETYVKKKKQAKLIISVGVEEKGQNRLSHRRLTRE